MKLRVLSASAQECISIEEARWHIEALAYGDTDVDTMDDAQILAWIKTAREYAEQFTGMSFVFKTYEGALDTFPEYIELPTPFGQVLSFTTGNATSSTSDDGLLTEGVDFYVDEFSNPPRLYPVTEWPAVSGARNGIRITFTAGYGQETDAEPVPYLVRAAMLLTLGHLYANREDVTEKAMQSLPSGAYDLMRPLRVRLGMA
jgi:uncharacterized phiE125 gp8 family phage protein